MSLSPQEPTAARSSDAASTGYKRGWVLFYGLTPLLFTPLALAAWRDPGPMGGRQWLVVGIALLATGLFAFARLGGARLQVTPEGLLTRRSAVCQQANLRRLSAVAITPSVPYPDQKRHDQFEAGREGYAVKYAYDVLDADGGRVQIAPRYMWQDEQPVLAQVLAALRESNARCDALCWTLLHRDSGVEVPPMPARLLEPQPGTWNTPLQIREANESTVMTATRAAVGLGALPQLAVGGRALMMGAFDGAIALATGLLTAAVGLLIVQSFVWRSRADLVRIEATGQLASVSRRARTANRLGWKLHEGRVDLHNLRRVELTPGTRTDGEGRPCWWTLELEDHLGGRARIDLFHAREPYATLLPQLTHHLEANGLALDRRTHDGLSLRLGRPLTNPTT